MAIPTWADTAYFDSGDADLTAYGRDKVGWQSTIGTTSIVQTGFVAQAGTCTFTVSNGDRRFDPNYAAGPYFGDLIPLVWFDKVATWASTPYFVFSGRIEEWPQSYPASGRDQISDIRVTDSIKDLAEAAQVSLTRPAEYTGARISAILTALDINPGSTIAHGDAIVAPIRKRQGSISAWSHIQDCVNAEWGEFYFDTAAGPVFRDRDTIFSEARSNTPQATFSDTTTLRYADIQMANLPIVNDCTITYGTRGRSVNFQDATSINTYGMRSLPLTLILSKKSAAKQYARWIVNRYKNPLTVPASITIKPGANPAVYFPQVLGRQLCDLITVVRTPRVNGVASAAISKNCWIRGISHSYRDHVWDATTFYLQEASWITGLFELDSSQLDGSDVLAW